MRTFKVIGLGTGLAMAVMAAALTLSVNPALAKTVDLQMGNLDSFSPGVGVIHDDLGLATNGLTKRSYDDVLYIDTGTDEIAGVTFYIGNDESIGDAGSAGVTSKASASGLIMLDPAIDGPAIAAIQEMLGGDKEPVLSEKPEALNSTDQKEMGASGAGTRAADSSVLHKDSTTIGLDGDSVIVDLGAT